jgi:hypothetical protein
MTAPLAHADAPELIAAERIQRRRVRIVLSGRRDVANRQEAH